MWDTKTWELVHTLEDHTAPVTEVSLTQEGKYVISASKDGTPNVWDSETGIVKTGFTGDSALRTCAVSPESKTIVAGEASGRVHFLRLEGDK